MQTAHAHHMFVFAYAISSFLASRLHVVGSRDLEPDTRWRLNSERALDVPSLSFLPAPDSIWMHADAIVGRLVDHVCCSDTRCCRCCGTTAITTPMCLRTAAALQSVPIGCLRTLSQNAVVLTEAAGSCSAKHIGNLRCTAADQQRSWSPFCMHCSQVTTCIARPGGREGLKAWSNGLLHAAGYDRPFAFPLGLNPKP